MKSKKEKVYVLFYNARFGTQIVKIYKYKRDAIAGLKLLNDTKHFDEDPREDSFIRQYTVDIGDHEIE